MSWVTEELRDLDLGDERRNRRLIQIVEDLAGSPESSVPLASRDRAALQGMYDFWSNPRIAASDILAAHVASAAHRSECHPLILAIQDTTELDYSHHPHKRGLGYLRGANTRGLLLHSVLAVSPCGTPMGILHHQLWARQGRGTQRQRRELAEKESYRWIESLDRTEALLSPSTHVLTIADREADFYDFITAERRPNSDYLIRVHHDRPIRLNPEDTSQSLHKLLQQLPASGYLRLNLQRTPRRAACEVILEVSWTSLWLQPPVTHAQREHLAPIKVQVIRAIEIDGDREDDQPLIEWTLITTLPISDLAAAQQLLQWYSYRWLIERYHYTLKSGCRVEHLQLETYDRLERAIATYAIVSWRLLWLTYLIRPTHDPSWDIEADWVLEPVEWQALCEYYKVPIPSEDNPPGFQQCLRWIAELGGFLGRKSDGDPGMRTIWRGMRRLRDLVIHRRRDLDPESTCCYCGSTL